MQVKKWISVCMLSLGQPVYADNIGGNASGIVLEEGLAKTRQTLRHLEHQYYSGHPPAVSDAEYDALARAYQQAGGKRDWLGADQPGNHGARIPHEYAMSSLNAAYQPSEIAPFLRQFEGHTLLLQPKVDGIAVELVYQQGVLTTASTRGDGESGRSIFPLLANAPHIPKQLSETIDAVVHGELYIRNSDFNTQLKQNYVSPRHRVAALANAKTFTSTDAQPLRFFPWRWPDAPLLSDQQAMVELAELGFDNVSMLTHLVTTQEEVGKKLLEFQHADLDMELDGIVLKLDDLAFRQNVGFTKTHPKWALAVKFAAESHTTRVRSVHYKVGRTGKITPILAITPAQIGGREITQVSAHNIDWLQQRGLAPGATIEVELAGNATPRLGRVLEKGDMGKLPLPPKVIPGLCITAKPGCTERFTLQVSHFASRQAFALEGLSKRVITHLQEKGELTQLLDLIRIDEQALQRAGVGESRRMTLVKQLSALPQAALGRWVYGLGLPGINPDEAQKIADTWPDFHQLLASEPEQWLALLGKQGVEAHAALQQAEMVAMLNELQAMREKLERGSR